MVLYMAKRVLKKKQHQESQEKQQQEMKTSNPVECFSFLEDIYSFPTYWCVCGFEYKYKSQLDAHLKEHNECNAKLKETDVNRLILITDLTRLKSELVNNEIPNIDKVLLGIEKLLSIVVEARFLYSSKFVLDPNCFNKCISEFFILLMGNVNKTIKSIEPYNTEQKERLNKCVASWKANFIDPNFANIKL